jgi:hypothetical protein
MLSLRLEVMDMPIDYIQCESCGVWYPFDELYYYLTDMHWMCDPCYSRQMGTAE